MGIWDTITETADAASIGAGFLLVDKAKTTTERKQKFLAAMQKLTDKTESKFIKTANDWTIQLASRPGVLEGLLDFVFQKK